MARGLLFVFCIFIFSIASSKIIEEVDVSDPLSSFAFESKFKKGFSNLKQDPNDSFDMCERRINPSEPNYFYFFPNFKAKLYKEGDVMTFKAGCFQDNTITLKKLTKEKNGSFTQGQKSKKFILF